MSDAFECEYSVICSDGTIEVALELDYELNADGASYSVTGNGDYESGTIKIPAEYNGLPVTRIAEDAGIDRKKIVLDPGIGFAKSYADNMEVLGSLGDFREWGYPLLLGCSRKSVIGYALDLPVEERLEGTLVTTMLAVQQGYSFVRVHDIKENVRAIRMTEAVMQGGMSLYGRDSH